MRGAKQTQQGMVVMAILRHFVKGMAACTHKVHVHVHFTKNWTRHEWLGYITV